MRASWRPWAADIAAAFVGAILIWVALCFVMVCAGAPWPDAPQWMRALLRLIAGA